MKSLVVLFFSVWPLLANSASQQPVEFPDVENNVAYAKVASLGFNLADEKIAYGSDESQYALLWRAKQALVQTPLVILLHGGCWLSEYDIKHTYALSTGLAQAGFNVWSLEYRRSGTSGGGWPVTFNDIKAGILAASTYNIGEFKLADSVAVGHSAGGHLALLAGGEISQLKGVIGLAPITDIKAYARGNNSCQKVTKDFMQGMPTDKPKAYTQANPSEQPLHPQSIILQGDKDAIVPAFNLAQLKRPVVMIEGVGHFDWIHPGTEAFSTLIKNLNEI
ncbi:MAG: acetyl esterase/lipase [Pseudoalteromonas tetraodonis]|uniref:alpha/beta hydrolase family protein n=1 Tax=Pseudoalteromonas TaxID=53246 RepID=UPI0001EF89A4|nr:MULTISPECIES: alpha/beta hydrolase [unclassified Pseudoalteromonas]ADT67520.1 Putative lipase/esterase [Pseudoalteromonas sp. SM9913]MDN3434469.1 alpha/beta hydrolase [Pseudoalteromonas sp. APC 3356]